MRIIIRIFWIFLAEDSISRAIFEDDVDKLKQLLITHSEDESSMQLDIKMFIPIKFCVEGKGNKLEVSELFGSVKCFKYLMMSGESVDENICKFAIAGGNNEIIHICEQNGLHFVDC